MGVNWGDLAVELVSKVLLCCSWFCHRLGIVGVSRIASMCLRCVLLELIAICVLPVHLLAMNVACGAPLLCIWLRRGEHDKSSARWSIGKSLAWFALGAYLLGLLTGGGLILLPSAEDLREAMGRFGNRTYWFAGSELLFSFLALWAYARLWDQVRLWRWVHAILAVAATSNLLYHFPPLMIVLGKLARDPAWSVESVIERSHFLELMIQPEVLSITIHFGLASLAVAALFVLALWARNDTQTSQKRICRIAAAIAFFASLLQLPIGIWVLAALPQVGRSAILGEKIFVSVLFLASMIATFYLLQGLVKIALGDFTPFDCWRVFWLTVCLVFVMTITMRLSRYEEQPGLVNFQKNSLELKLQAMGDFVCV
ncbi:MAG TPA: hypothetical protein DHW22_03940 [Planctomycetaceae bacterium]|nr:hypothetical protein [Planctomycetaceae bacterium]